MNQEDEEMRKGFKSISISISKSIHYGFKRAKEDSEIECNGHRKLNQVVFAEADKDFLDILFSFLTIPLGTIVRLLRKQSHPTVIGSLNNLHTSVENLEERRFQTEICKTMLLGTRNAYGDECRKLELNIDDTEPTSFYLCQPCASKRIGGSLLSTFDSRHSSCGSRLTPMTLRSRPNGSEVDGEDGVFVKGMATFLVTDDLQVTPLSTLATFRLLNNLGITDAVLLEKKSLDVDFEQVLNLIKHSMLSKAPITEVFLREQRDLSSVRQFKGVQKILSLKKKCINNCKKIHLKATVRKSDKKVVYAEAGEDFVSFIFSVLTFPLGSVVELLDCSPVLGCIANLYKSVKELNVDRYLKSEDHKVLLLSPKLALQYSCNKDQPLSISEAKPHNYYYKTSSWGEAYLFDETFLDINNPGEGTVTVNLLNPKSPAPEATKAEGFVKGPAMFMVTDDLVVTPFSSISCITYLEELKVPFSDIEEKVVVIGDEEGQIILEAALTSNLVLTSVLNFCLCAKKPKEEK